MFARIKPILLVIPLTVYGWDSPLPFSNGVATGTGLGAFSNPAATAFGDGGVYDFAWSQWSDPASLGASGRNRLWGLHYQGEGHAEGLRLWEGDGPYRARFDAAFGTTWFGLVSPGVKLAYVFQDQGANHPLMDVGFDFRPWRQFLFGYWMENFLTGGNEKGIYHWAAGVKPLAALHGWPAEIVLGLGITAPDSGKRSNFVYAQVPLPFGFRFQSNWDGKNHDGSVALTVQVTPEWLAGLGWSRSVPSTGIGNFDPTGIRRHQEAAVEYSPKAHAPFLLSSGTVAELDLNHSIVEGESPDGLFGQSGEIGFLDLKKRFEVIKANRRIKSVLVKLGHARCGWAMGEEIRLGLNDLRAHGKKITVYMEQVTPLNYFLASGADVIAMQPQGYFAVTGFAAEETFYRGLFDKLGVEPEFLRHGKYKSFEEPYTRTSFSEPARANLASFLGSLWDHYLDVVAEARHIQRDSLRKELDGGDISLAHARKAGLIDTLIHQDQAVELAGGKGAVIARDLGEEVARDDWNLPPEIAVVVVEGDMVLGNSASAWLAGPELAGSETVAGQLRRARMTSSVKAVVLRVDSPGGSAQAADVMWREVELLKQAGKPVIASVGHDAASGGYYLICGADEIIAEPNSALGSIGVLWGKFVLKGLYNKLGLNVETVKTSPHADANSLSRAWDSTEVEILQKHMDDFYDDFISKVAAGRKKSKAAVDSLGQGQVFTGTQSLKNGLIDRIGGLDEAVAEAARLAGIKKGRPFKLLPIESEEKTNPVTMAGRNLAHAQADDVAGKLARYLPLAQADLWAISPELSGWFGEIALTRE